MKYTRAVCLILELYLYGMCKVNHEVNRYVILKFIYSDLEDHLKPLSHILSNIYIYIPLKERNILLLYVQL